MTNQYRITIEPLDDSGIKWGFVTEPEKLEDGWIENWSVDFGKTLALTIDAYEGRL